MRHPPPVLRVARPTDDLRRVVRFYIDGVGLELLGAFEGHAGYDGVILGHHDSPWQLELTHRRGHPAGRCPSDEHLLVLYLREIADWAAAVNRLRQAGHAPVLAANPYWNVHGHTFQDPDGYGLVLTCGPWAHPLDLP